MSQSYTTNRLFKEVVEHGLSMTQGDEPFFPFMDLVTNHGKVLNVLVADDIQQSLQSATDIIMRQEETPLMYALVWDGRLTVDGEKTDCLFIEIGTDSGTKANVIAQPYSGSDPAIASGSPIGIETKDSRILLCKMIGPFNAIEWNNIINLPVLLFILVAGADGEIDKKELDAFLEVLKSPVDPDNLFSSLLMSSSNDMRDIFNEIQQSSYDKWQNLEIIMKTINKKLDGNAIAEIKSDICKFTESIAKSSGGVLGFGGKIGKEEKIIIDKINSIIQI